MLPPTDTPMGVESTLVAASVWVGAAETDSVAVLVPPPVSCTVVAPAALPAVLVAATENVVGPESKGPVVVGRLTVQEVPEPVIVTVCGPVRVLKVSFAELADFDVVAVTVMADDRLPVELK